MLYTKTMLSLSAAASVLCLLGGCSPDPNGPAVERPESEAERTFSDPVPEQSAPATPADACSTSGEGLRRPIWTDAGDVNVNLSPVFAGDPDMDDVFYDDTRADSYDNYSEDFDPERLLVVVLKRTDLPLEADDLTDFSFQPAEAEGEFRTCDEPLDTDVRFIGTRDAGDGESASVWEISSAGPLFDRSNLAKVTLDVRQAHVEAWPDRYVKRQEHVEDVGARSPRRDPAFDDLAFYYANR